MSGVPIGDNRLSTLGFARDRYAGGGCIAVQRPRAGPLEEVAWRVQSGSIQEPRPRRRAGSVGAAVGGRCLQYCPLLVRIKIALESEAQLDDVVFATAIAFPGRQPWLTRFRAVRHARLVPIPTVSRPAPGSRAVPEVETPMPGPYRHARRACAGAMQGSKMGLRSHCS